MAPKKVVVEMSASPNTVAEKELKEEQAGVCVCVFVPGG